MITLYAPGTLVGEGETFGAPIIRNDDGRSILVQDDWDYPGIASSFGWYIGSVEPVASWPYSVPCDHGATDGTVACDACGLTPSAFIDAAYDWLREHSGATADDPGYFAEV